jgi:hypothetical protein
VHASASPFEALAERCNWLGADFATDPYGAELVAAGVPVETLKAWSVDPQVRSQPHGRLRARASARALTLPRARLGASFGRWLVRHSGARCQRTSATSALLRCRLSASRFSISWRT